MQPINFPVLGNSLVMAITILVHVFFAFIAVGGILIAVTSEWFGYSKKNPFHDRFAKGYINFISEMMKLGGVLGVMIVVFLVGLFPEFTKALYNYFFWPLVIETVLFFILMGATIYYKTTWMSSENKNWHIAVGAVAGLSAVLSALIINAMHAFMLTPGKYFDTRSIWDAVLNPTTAPSSLHLLIPCLANAAAFAFIYSMWKGRRTGADDREYLSWMKNYSGKIFAGAILLQPFSGLSFLMKVKTANPTAYDNIITGIASPFFWTMVTLAAIAVLSSLTFWLTRCRAKNILLVGTLAALTAFSFGGYTRERARKPWLVYGHISMGDAVAAEAPAPSKVSKKDLLSNHGCLACHKFEGTGGTFGPPLEPHLKHHPKNELKKFLKNPPAAMPPFQGSEKELDEFVDGITK